MLDLKEGAKDKTPLGRVGLPMIRAAYQDDEKELLRERKYCVVSCQISHLTSLCVQYSNRTVCIKFNSSPTDSSNTSIPSTKPSFLPQPPPHDIPHKSDNETPQ